MSADLSDLVAASTAELAAGDGRTDRWWSHRGIAMGCSVDVRGWGEPASAALVPALLDRMERCWSRFDPASDLTALNGDPRPVVEVPLLLGAAVQRAVTAWRCTDGAFDPTVHDALVAAGYDRSFEQLPERAVPTHPGLPVAGCADVEVELDDHAGLLDPDAPAAVVRRPPGRRLDLGGIGKGLAADLVADVLLAAGVRSVIVSLGGDVRVAGRVPRGGFAVPVTDPWDGTTLTSLVLASAGAVVTSSTRRRRWQTADGGWAHHLIDPRTGQSADRGVAAVVVAASEAWWAECLAKAALVMGVVDGAALLERHSADGLVLRDDTGLVRVGGQSGGSLSNAVSSALEPMPSFP